MYDLIEKIEGIEVAQSAAQDLDSNRKVIQKIRVALLESNNPNVLRDEFEKWDKKHEGLLDPANFKTCL